MMDKRDDIRKDQEDLNQEQRERQGHQDQAPYQNNPHQGEEGPVWSKEDAPSSKGFHEEENPRYRIREEDMDEYRGYKHNIYPRVFYGGFGVRLIAFIFDSLIAAAMGKIILSPLITFIPGFNPGIKTYSLLMTLIGLAYFTLTTYFTNGQSLGKMIMGLRVVSFKEEKLSFITCFIREFVGRFILSYGILDILYGMVLFTKKRQHLVDMFADTSVIIEEAKEEYVHYKKGMYTT